MIGWLVVFAAKKHRLSEDKWSQNTDNMQHDQTTSKETGLAVGVAFARAVEVAGTASQDRNSSESRWRLATPKRWLSSKGLWQTNTWDAIIAIYFPGGICYVSFSSQIDRSLGRDLFQRILQERGNVSESLKAALSADAGRIECGPSFSQVLLSWRCMENVCCQVWKMWKMMNPASKACYCHGLYSCLKTLKWHLVKPGAAWEHEEGTRYLYWRGNGDMVQRWLH